MAKEWLVEIQPYIGLIGPTLTVMVTIIGWAMLYRNAVKIERLKYNSTVFSDYYSPIIHKLLGYISQITDTCVYGDMEFEDTLSNRKEIEREFLSHLSKNIRFASEEVWFAYDTISYYEANKIDDVVYEVQPHAEILRIMWKFLEQYEQFISSYENFSVEGREKIKEEIMEKKLIVLIWIVYTTIEGNIEDGANLTHEFFRNKQYSYERTMEVYQELYVSFKREEESEVNDFSKTMLLLNTNKRVFYM